VQKLASVVRNTRVEDSKSSFVPDNLGSFTDHSCSLRQWLICAHTYAEGHLNIVLTFAWALIREIINFMILESHTHASASRAEYLDSSLFSLLILPRTWVELNINHELNIIQWYRHAATCAPSESQSSWMSKHQNINYGHYHSLANAHSTMCSGQQKKKGSMRRSLLPAETQILP
jgi:hypothetical protein